MDDDNAIEKLIAPYFVEVCRRVLDQYLAALGFAFNEVGSTSTSVKYSKDDLYIEFSHWPEDAPRYVVMSVLGLDNTRDGTLSYPKVGLWYIVREKALEEERNDWDFSTSEELEAVLFRMRDEVLETYVRPLWDDRPSLLEIIQQSEQEHKTIEKARMGESKSVSQARAAFDEGNYSLALKLYRTVDPSILTKADLKRIDIAVEHVITE